MVANIGVMVSTRFGIGVDDEEWFRHRLELFEAITASCLKRQTNQGFVWNIFIGETPKKWVVDRLLEITEGIGHKVFLHYTRQSAVKIREVAASLNKKYILLGLIDDDDAWSVDLIERNLMLAGDFIARGRSKVAFTYGRGYEWIISDLVDVDALLAKNKKIIRKQSIRQYAIEFHSMSCFLVAQYQDIPEEFARMHATKGKAVESLGFDIEVQDNNVPAWLYVRHRHADSGLRKSHTFPPEDISLEKLAQLFGIDPALVGQYQRTSEVFGYSKKRMHSESDKSQLTFDVNIDAEFKVDDGAKYTLERLEPNVRVEESGKCQAIYSLLDKYKKIRVVVYDAAAAKFVWKKVFTLGDSVVLDREAICSSDCKLKCQIQDERNIWVDLTPYSLLV